MKYSSVSSRVTHRALIGQRVFYPFRSGLITEAFVDEIDDILVAPQHLQDEFKLSSATVWVFWNAEGIIQVHGYSKVHEHPWDFYDIPKEHWTRFFSESELVNQEVWLDEPIGHAVNLNWGDEAFVDLAEAQAYVKQHWPGDKRQVKRAHRKLQTERRRVQSFINRTHELAGSSGTCPLITTPKKIFKVIGR